MKRLVFLILAFIILLFMFLIYVKVPKNYSYNYKVNGYKVTEKYKKNKKYYLFDIKKNKKTYKYAISSNYISKRGLISKITKDGKCIEFLFNKENKYSVCLNGGKTTTSFFDKVINSKKMDKYQKINIYNLMDNTYYIWNYNEFLNIDGTDNKKVDLFDSDIYELKLITQVGEYLCIADYNEKYQFNTFYLVDMKTNKIKEVKLNRKFSMDSIILGVDKDFLYLYDPKKEKEYKIDLFKETVDDNAYEILVNGRWEKVSVHKLNKGNTKFRNDSDFIYKIKGNKLYYQLPNVDILVSDMDVSKIVLSDENNCYFISKDTLYHVDINTKITKVMSYSEWQFNNNNIYIY